MMLATLDRALRAITEELSDFDPALITTSDAARVFEAFTSLERAVVAGKTLVAGRAAESGQWREQGHRSPAAWMAQTTGTGLGEAIAMLETAQQLASLPETTEALKRAELSGPQVKVIASTAAENPSTEAELLGAAKRHSLKGLKDECRRLKARSVSEADARARYEQIRKNRSLFLWTDQDGVGRVEAKLTPDDLARLTTAVRTESNAIFAEARKAGHREPTVAYEADALVALVTGTSLTGAHPTRMPVAVGRARATRSGASGRSCAPPTTPHASPGRPGRPSARKPRRGRDL
jgi:hypothetical protein